MLQLGVGLIRIGRVWGHVVQSVPAEHQARAFLEHAWRSGIRMFDTAPSYGTSEPRTGAFLKTLTAAERDELVVATKFGEDWDENANQPFVDHSYDALRRSLDRSVERLGRIEILQLHKTSPEVLAGDELARAWEYARSLGIARLGPSVSDLKSAEMALAEARYCCIQLPLNQTDRRFEEAARRATARGMYVLANRPYAMGAVTGGDPFGYLHSLGLNGVVLTGTANPQHLSANIEAFERGAAA